MATRLFSIAPGATLETVVDAAGIATVTSAIELTVDLATTIVTEGGSTRAIKKSEVVTALNTMVQYILRSTVIPD